jgi:hypothetical protein
MYEILGVYVWTDDWIELLLISLEDVMCATLNNLAAFFQTKLILNGKLPMLASC